MPSNGLKAIGGHDLGGYGDGMQVLRHQHALYVGHHGVSRQGTSILDVSDPVAPRLVAQWAAPANTHTHKVQVGSGLLLVNHEQFPANAKIKPGRSSAGLAVYDIADPLAPVQIGFWESGGRGVHRIVYSGGSYAYLSATPAGFDDRIWMILDLSEPTRPRATGSWWWPGQCRSAGEQPAWPAGCRYAAHHALLDGDLAYLGYGDANLVVLDVSDRGQPRLVSNLRWDGGDTHTCLPLPARRIVVVTDEQVRNERGAPPRGIRLIDVANPAQPRVLSVFPTPSRRFAIPGARFGAHNLHENRPDSYRSEALVFATYFSAGVRVYDIRNTARPVEVAYWMPDDLAAVPQTNDIFVDSRGLVYASDRTGGGIAILQPEPDLANLMTELAVAGS